MIFIRILLFLFSVFMFGSGCLTLLHAKAVTHQALGAIEMLTAAVLFSAAALLDGLISMRKLLVAIEAGQLRIIALHTERVSAPAATAPPPQSEPTYWVRMGDETTGPFPLAQIRELKNRGAIADETPLARDGGNEWKTVKDVLSS